MCVAAPGKIISIENNKAKLQYASNIVFADTGIVDAKVGDWVLVHAGLVIQVLKEDEAQAMKELFEELENI